MSHWRNSKRPQKNDSNHLLESLLSNVAEAKKKRCVEPVSAARPIPASVRSGVNAVVPREASNAAGSEAARPPVPLPKALPPLAFYSAAPEHSFVDDFLKRRVAALELLTLSSKRNTSCPHFHLSPTLTEDGRHGPCCRIRVAVTRSEPPRWASFATQAAAFDFADSLPNVPVRVFPSPNPALCWSKGRSRLPNASRAMIV